MLTVRDRPLLVVPSMRWPDYGGRARDADLAQVQVDVAPAEIEQFAARGAGVCGEAVEGE
jgi:hypothetical protein